jgi:hypothetical protein
VAEQGAVLMAALCADYAGLVRINTFCRSAVALPKALVRWF